MKDDVISRRAVIDLIHNSINDLEYNDENEDLIESVKALPSAEPEIIMCKDCRHWLSDEFPGNNNVSTLNLSSYPCKIGLTGADWFCGYAERRADESD